MAQPDSRPARRRVTMLGLFAMAWTIGVADSFGYDNFGVFTTNQAGNLVVFAKAPWQDWPQARLAGLALLGAMIGVLAGTALSRWVTRWPGAGLAVPASLGTIGLIVAAGFTIEGSRPSWLVPVMSASTACMAAGWAQASSVKLWLTANTGGFLSTVRALGFPDATPGSAPRHRHLTTIANISALVLTAGFVSGVFMYGLGALDWPHPLVFAVIPAIAVSALAVRDELRGTGFLEPKPR